MAATNRPEVLDPALLRAGRFDRQIAVGNPDLIGRMQILQIHSKNVKLAPDFDLERAARMTPGFSGADLANVMNEAALLAARRNAKAVTMQDFEAAIERVVAGLEKKTRVMNEQERNTVAYHESRPRPGRRSSCRTPTRSPRSASSHEPRRAGLYHADAHRRPLPADPEELKDRIAVMLGGRAAEQVVFWHISTGASDDINRATDLARRMVTEFGMSEKLGLCAISGQQLQYLNGAVRG